MTVDVYTDLGTIPSVTADALSVKSGLAFFSSIEWFRCLLEHGTSSGVPRLYVSSNADSIQCAVYCLAQGRKLQSLTSFYTIEYGPVMIGSDDMNGLTEIARHIEQERPRWTTLALRNLHEADLDSVSSAFEKTRFSLHPWKQTENWYLEVDNRSFEQYYGSLGSQLRNTLQRKSRKTEREHEIRLAIYPGEGLTLNEAIAHYETIYAASWKDNEPFPQFMPTLFRICDENNLIRVGMAWVDGKPAAAQIWINDKTVNNNRTIIYKLAYDQQFGPLSIGSMLSLALFRNAIDVDRVSEIDYGVGDEPYKRNWMSDSRSLSGLLACNQATVAGQLKNLRENLSRLIRRKNSLSG